MVPVAKPLPRVITDTEEQDVRAVLEQLRKEGIEEVLAGNLGHVMMARDLGLAVRGDFGLNVFNSYSLDIMRNAGLISVTASFELRIAQIKDMLKSIDTEIILRQASCRGFGPVHNKAERRQMRLRQPGSLLRTERGRLPVVKEFGCRNVKYSMPTSCIWPTSGQLKRRASGAQGFCSMTESLRRPLRSSGATRALRITSPTCSPQEGFTTGESTEQLKEFIRKNGIKVGVIVLAVIVLIGFGSVARNGQVGAGHNAPSE